MAQPVQFSACVRLARLCFVNAQSCMRCIVSHRLAF
jgi:hypothetical protein